MTRKIIYTAFFIASASFGIFAQTPSPTPTAQPSPQASPTPTDLETILTEAAKQIVNYQETFKDLLATETKTFEDYDKKGELDERTIVESIFLVYQSSKNEKTSSELRNVIKVNDKPIPDSQARADKFLAELQKSSTLEKELEKLEDEGLRYDKTFQISGLTLFEAVGLSDNLRSFFDFKLLGSETYQGNEVYVVSYHQTKTSPSIAINRKAVTTEGAYIEYKTSIPGELKKNDIFLRGKLWIDAKTFQVWREERQVAVQTTAPIVAQETVFEYVPSEFGVLVPKKITFTEYSIKKISKSEEFSVVKNSQVVFDYSKFKKTNVEVKIIDEP